MCNHNRLMLFITLLGMASFLSAAQDTVDVGLIKVSVSDQALHIPVKAAIDSGILEYLLVANGGKTYESVLSTECKPKDFHAALLLINAKAGGVTYRDDKQRTAIVKGDTMTCDIVYTSSDGKRVTFPAFDLVRHCDRKKMAEGESFKKKTSWVFIGSQEIDMNGSGQMIIASVMDGSLISIIIDPSVEISLSEKSENPYQGENMGFCINETKIKQLPANCFLRIARKKK